MTMETGDKLAKLFELQHAVESADDTWFEALKAGLPGKDEKAVYNDAKAAYRSHEMVLMSEGATVECGRCGGEGAVGFGNVFFAQADGGSERTCFACHGARRLPLRKHTFSATAATRFRKWTQSQAAEAEKAAAEEAKWTAFAAGYPAVAEWLAAQYNAAPRDEDGYGGFFPTMYEKARRFGSLTERQMAAVTNEMERLALRAVAVPCPTGTVTVEGTVTGTYDKRGYTGGTVMQMKVALEGEYAGNTVGGTIPEKVWDALCDEKSRRTAPLTGTRVRFTATVTRSDRDEHWGFYKSPKRVEVLHVEWHEEG